MAIATATPQGTGRRKRAVARVRLTLGSGEIKINDRPIEAYLGRATLLQIVRQPLEATNSVGRFNIEIAAHGGGLSGQAGAIRHGIARALVLDYGDFTVAGDLTSLEMKDAKPCEK